jgi:hypothetical protein
VGCLKTNFITLEEHREQIINKILKWKQSLIAVRTIDFLVNQPSVNHDVISEARPDDVYTYYLVLCDDGVERNILGNKFISTEAHREQMLNKILKS